MTNPLTNLLSRVRKARKAARLADAAGRPSRAQGRRGTVLILVVGALALISVITLVYFSIGQSDLRQAASTRTRADVQGAGTAVAEYVAQQIADGPFATQVAGSYVPIGGNQPVPVLVRTAADYPWTDSYRLSVLPANPTPAMRDRAFDTTGSYSRVWPQGSGADPRIPTTPFLAVSQPGTLAITPLATPPDFNHRDWLHITNIAPDARFVNLYNLAFYNQASGQHVSGFDAAQMTHNVQANGTWTPQAPAINTTTGAVKAEMSYALSLFDLNGNPTQNLDPIAGGTAALFNCPAHWADRQQWMFRPAAGPVFFGGVQAPQNDPNGINPNSPASMWYPPYQYCDADGDGFFDSRWIELVDARDPLNPISFLPKDNRYRWFAAVRVIDLSAAVNVNTATDFHAPIPAAGVSGPQATKFGATPADVDLARLLTMDDFFRFYVNTAPPIGYQALERPLQPNGPDDYFPNYAFGDARNIGDCGYKALRFALRPFGESVLSASTNLANPGPAQLPVPPQLWADARAAQYSFLGGQTTAGYELSAGIQQFESSALFGAADLKELLTFWTINNPNTTSRLEQVLDGRFNTANVPGTIQTGWMGPMRSNRPLALDGRGNDNLTTENGGLGNGEADPDAYARAEFDLRHYLTTLSGRRPLRPVIISQTAATTNLLHQDVDVAVDAIGALKKATVTTPSDRDPSVLFKGYADALDPYSMVRNANGSAWVANSRFATLNFAHNAELALRSAAAMTVNMIDAWDKDRVPTACTLLLDWDARQTVSQGGPTAAFPWWNELPGNGTPQPYRGRLDLGDSRLAHVTTQNDQIAAAQGAINVYGVEAQPFITQVVTMFIYTDTPHILGGDPDYNGAVPPAPLGNITINGDKGYPGLGGPISLLPKPDFIGEIIAFQLTNPFDVDIDLTFPANGTPPAIVDYSDYYIEFGTDLYKLADVRNAAAPTPIKLRRGQSRVFYCFDRGANDMYTRINHVDPTTFTSPVIVRQLVENQFGTTTGGVQYAAGDPSLQNDGRVKPIEIKRMGPSGGPPTSVQSLFHVQGNNPPEYRRVMLWRVLRGQSEQSGTANQRYNDMLVDVLRDPGSQPTGTPNFVSTLDRSLKGQQSVANTQAGQEPTGQDNTGFSIVTWGSIKRLNDPGQGTGSTPMGALPAYCVEAKWGTGTTPLKNRSITEGANIAGSPQLERRDFINHPNADTTFPGLINKIAPTLTAGPPTLAGVIVKTIATHPKEWKTLLQSNASAFPTGINTMQSNQDATPRPYDRLYPVLHLHDDEYTQPLQGPTGTGPLVSTLRLADLLLPLGICPMNDPGITATGDPTESWLTLGEGLALALNYDSPAANTPGWGIYARAGDSQTGFLDRGHLTLDRFAPFEDVNAAPPGVFGAGDEVRFPGIPLALNVLNMFTVTEPQFGSLTKATPGLLNINTIAAPVSRLIPLLTPTSQPDIATNTINGVWDAWKVYAGVAGNDTVPEPTRGAVFGTDIGATLISYRDKLNVLDRDARPITFVDGGTISPFDPLNQDGRRLTTQPAPGPQILAEAVRETRGFGSVGELLTMNRSGPATLRFPVEDRISFLGSDNFNSGAAQMNSTLFLTTGGTTQQIDGVIDDYAEKLTVAAAALGTVSVRSDYFAVWFVIHGYQKSDTEGLGVNDPLKPSVAKRFLMVVDRSNVTRKGEKPRIVFLTEVPM